MRVLGMSTRVLGIGMHYLLTQTLRFRPGKEAPTQKLLASFAARTEALPGCMNANVYADARHEDVLLFIEEWASHSALEAHLQSESFRSLQEAVAASSDVPELHIHQIIQTTDASVLVRCASEVT